MPSSSFHSSYSPTATADAQGFRQLNDEVLQSAEDAVLVEAAAPGGDIFPTTTASPDSHAPVPYPAPSSYKKNVGQYVATNPCQSALMAAAMGALAAMLLRSRLRKQAISRGWTRPS
ncbi:hypothetical protein [Polaromonas sp.]|uniref:hypothetical protein n=1 Tax=Polaromonas sp. TaxID=1869339 RepID=UPI0017A8EFEA|nr:hypothetical protein [Polaromonas sp.]NMM07446.1 hypothetical protein [Polaromonas sp.]